ncbi:hypothetical protein Hanom_Chr14g01289671 [Helianthus anomalus]
MNLHIAIGGMEYMGTGCLSGRQGSGPSKFSTHIACFIDGHSLLSGLKHHKPTTIKHPISCSSKSPFNLSSTTSNSFPPPYLAPNPFYQPLFTWFRLCERTHEKRQ